MSDVFFYRRRRSWSRDARSRDVCLPRDGANNELDQIFVACRHAPQYIDTRLTLSCGYFVNWTRYMDTDWLWMSGFLRFQTGKSVT